VGVPLGIVLTRRPAWRAPVLRLANVFQTIPSLALVGFRLPVFSIGAWPPITAHLLHPLLPFIQNTYNRSSRDGPAVVRDRRWRGGRSEGRGSTRRHGRTVARAVARRLQVARPHRCGREELHRVRPAGGDRGATDRASAARASAAAAAPGRHVRVSSGDHGGAD